MKINYSFEQESQEFVEEVKSTTTVITNTVDKVLSFGKEFLAAMIADRNANRTAEQAMQLDQLSRTVELLSRKIDRLESQPKEFYKK